MVSRTDIGRLLLLCCGAVYPLQFSHLTLRADDSSRPGIVLPKTVEDVSSIVFAADDRFLLLGVRVAAGVPVRVLEAGSVLDSWGSGAAPRGQRNVDLCFVSVKCASCSRDI